MTADKIAELKAQAAKAQADLAAAVEEARKVEREAAEKLREAERENARRIAELEQEEKNKRQLAQLTPVANEIVSLLKKAGFADAHVAERPQSALSSHKAIPSIRVTANEGGDEDFSIHIENAYKGSGWSTRQVVGFQIKVGRNYGEPRALRYPLTLKDGVYTFNGKRMVEMVSKRYADAVEAAKYKAAKIRTANKSRELMEDLEKRVGVQRVSKYGNQTRVSYDMPQGIYLNPSTSNPDKIGVKLSRAFDLTTDQAERLVRLLAQIDFEREKELQTKKAIDQS